jgi:tetratricopeptide (TPR) repeat protein
MKAEQRKELERNVLAQKLNDIGEALKNRPSNRTFMVLGAIALVVLGVFLFRYYGGRSSKQTSALWLGLEGINNVDELGSFAQKNAGTTAARTARFEEARAVLKRGVENLSADDLKKARDLYQALTDQCKDMPLLKQECLMNRARAEEALCGSEASSLDKALDLYDQLAKEFPDSFQGKAAEERAAAIRKDRESVLKFYADLTKQAPR